MTEHEANNLNNDDDDYCHTSACLLQRANEMMDRAETEAYWNDIRVDDYLSELERLD
jgi:hypothetical protein